MAWYLDPSIPVIGCTAIGIGSKTIKIKNEKNVKIMMLDIIAP